MGKLVKFNTNYQGLGIDRVMACKTIDSGVVIDAGTAITIDIMSGGVDLGGYILPGISALQKCYGEISENLNHNFTMEIEREILPYNTVEAISYGGIGMIISLIENIAKIFEKEGADCWFTDDPQKFLGKKHYICTLWPNMVLNNNFHEI